MDLILLDGSAVHIRLYVYDSYLLCQMLTHMLELIDGANDMRTELEGPAHGPLGTQHAPWLAALAVASDAVAAGCPLLTEALRCVWMSREELERVLYAAGGEELFGFVRASVYAG